MTGGIDFLSDQLIHGLCALRKFRFPEKEQSERYRRVLVKPASLHMSAVGHWL
jgi:hypothetical protein